jgi:natural product biosynthesis luciferase-like monooxygenase protein/amino acid adenylation domain-containing protein
VGLRPPPVGEARITAARPWVFTYEAFAGFNPVPERAWRYTVITVATKSNGMKPEPTHTARRAYPLSPLQQGLLFHALATPHSGVDIEQVVVGLRETLDLAAWERAWQRVTEHHEVLRTNFHWHGTTEPHQEIQPRVTVPIHCEDWRGIPADKHESAWPAWLEAERLREFNLATAPLFRIALFQFSETDWRLVWTFHHLLLDAQGIRIVLRDVFALYEAFQSGQEQHWPSPRPFRDHIEWLQKQDRAAAEEFWRERMKGFTAPTSLPSPASSEREGKINRGEQELLLSAAATEALDFFAATHHLTLNTLVQGAWALLLARYSGTHDIVFGAVRNGRRSSVTGAEAIAGLFINTVPVRARVAPDLQLGAWLAELRANWIALRPFEHTALVDVQSWSEMPSATPLFETLVNFQPRSTHSLLADQGSGWKRRQVTIVNQPNYPLTLDVCGGDSLHLKILYDAHRFDAPTIKRMLGHLRTLLEAFPARAEARLRELPLLTNEEQQQLAQWNETHADYSKDQSVCELFEAQAQRAPEALAVRDKSGGVTYAQLNQRANGIAVRLRSLGVGPDQCVGVCLERSVELVAVLLGIWKSGGAYLPLDPGAPVERLKMMLSDAQAPVLLTHSSLRGKLTGAAAELKVVCVDELPSQLPEPGAVEKNGASSSHQLAYVIYTSGSTGAPKGVAVEHASLSNLISWHQRTYHLSGVDRATLLANPAFDASVWELWPYLTAGASIHIPGDETIHRPDKLVSWLAARQITMAFVPTPLAETLFDESWPKHCTLRALLTGGDKLNRRPPETFPSPVFNHYGPTECTVVATSKMISTAKQGVPSIGRPISNTQIFILDDQLQPVPIGVSGEIFIAGDALARGYLNRPELTAERFITTPVGGNHAPAIRLYQTGDLARWQSDGNIEFLGRTDQQVKLRGHRIELGEIEAVLAQHSGVREAVVTANALGTDSRLCAFVVAKADTNLTADSLRDFLRVKLPDYMLPATFALLDQLPLTPNGKIDRIALAHLTADAAPEEKFVAPDTATQQTLAAIWCEVLGVERVGIHDNFFHLGGHSLRAAQVVSRLETEFQREFPLRVLFESPTIAALALQIEAAGPQRKEGAMTEAKEASESEFRLGVPRLHGCIRSDSDGAELQASATFPLSFAQERLWFLEQLQPGTPFNNIPFAFHLEGVLNIAALQRAGNELIRRHDVFRTGFGAENGQPRARWQTPPEWQLPVVDLSPLPKAEREAKVKTLTEAEAQTPFNLNQSPLLRAKLLRLGTDDHVLLLTTHHLVCDGWSMTLLWRELGALYEAFLQDRQLPDPTTTLRYADFSRWQRENLADEKAEAAPAFWKQQLATANTALDLPTDWPRPAIQTYRGASIEFNLPGTLAMELRRLSRQEGVTLYMLLLAAFQTVLHRYTGATDILIGTPAAGRVRVETENVVGLFLNTLVMRGDLSDAPTFRELLQRTRQTALEAFAHQDLPFEKLTEAIQPDRDLSRSPLFQVMFVLQNAPQCPLELAGLKVTRQRTHSGTAKFDLTLSLEENAAGLSGALEFNADLFDAATIQRLSDHFKTVLAGAVAEPGQRISELPLLTTAEEQQLIAWNQTQADFSADSCIHELFVAQVKRTPDAIALVCGDDELTYRALNEQADQLAEQLRALGVGPEVRVGICVERSLEMMIGLLGILKAGGCYVPLDPKYPRERLAFMLADSEAAVLLTQAELDNQFQFENSNCIVTSIETLLTSERKPFASSGDSAEAHPKVSAANLAYILYTSGSTGKPKGVMVTHRNVVNFFTGMDQVLGTDPGVWLAVTSISFDISVLELFWTLARGFKVVIQTGEGQNPAPSRRTALVPPMDFSLFYFASDATERGEDRYRLLTEGAKFADANGFSAVWTPERHFHPFGGIFPNPSVVSAAVAMITQRIQIRAGSIVLPLHHPVRVAEEWSVVDNLSRGRAAISIASGWHANDFALAPENYSARKEIMRRNVELIRRLWRGEEVEWPLPDNKLVRGRIFPRPIQNELPIWVTSSGNPETFQLAGELGCHLLTHLSGQELDKLAAKIALYQAARRQHHPTAPSGQVSVMLHTFVGKDVAVARETVRAPLFNYLRTYRDLSESAHALPPALQAREAQEARNGELTRLLHDATERYLESCGLFGTPDSCLATIEKLRAAGVSEVACLIDFGIAADAVLESLNFLNELRERANRNSSLRVRSGGAAEPDGRWRSVAENILHHRVTHLQCTPSLAGALILAPESLEAMRRLSKMLLGGEALPLDLARRLRAEVPGDLFNLYGPTETTIWSAAQRVESVANGVPIGRPIANTQIHLLDANLQRVPIGVPGEIFIGGTGVARGYWNRPDLNQVRFVADPFKSDATDRLYRTGDLARWRVDGTIEFLGRLDQQIKLRGHRIELGEIESVLRAQPSVQDCVVTVSVSDGDQRLVAYIVAAPGKEVVAPELRRSLEIKLPEYMIPATFVPLEKLPLLPNGKLNRKQLPEPTAMRPSAATNYAAPQSSLEQTIAGVWRELLKVERVGRNDNFFDLGGHSLLVVQEQAKLRAALGVNVPVVRLFQYPTVSRLAGFLGERNEDNRLQHIRQRGRRQREAFSQHEELEVIA